jgi:hypothetical protein
VRQVALLACRKPANSKFRSLEDECNWILSGREPLLGTSFTEATLHSSVSTYSPTPCQGYELVFGRISILTGFAKMKKEATS